MANDVTDLGSRALLADLTIGCWGGQSTDRTVSDEVACSKEAQNGAGSWATRLIPPSALKQVFSAANQARAIHNRFTLPWSDSGPRILPSPAFFDYTQAIRKAQTAYQEAVNDFLKDYPQLVGGAEQRLGRLFKREKFPSTSELKEKFSFDVRFQPVPDVRDFRVDMGKEMADQVKDSIREQTEKAMAATMTDLYRRLHSVVADMAKKLKDPDKKFRDSLVVNVKEVCQLLPKLNVTDDPKLTALRDMVEAQLASHDAETLRSNKVVRQGTADKAAMIADKLEGLMGQHEAAPVLEGVGI